MGQSAIVRGHHQGDAFGSDQVEQKLKDRGAGFFVERAGGLVGEQDLGLFISARQSAVRWRSPPESFWMR